MSTIFIPANIIMKQLYSTKVRKRSPAPREVYVFR